MNILVVSTDVKLHETRPFWIAARANFPFQHVVVERESGMVAYFSQGDFSAYDRVIVDTNLRRMGKGYKCLKGLPGLVIWDHDVCQQNVKTSEWYKRFPAVLRDIGQCRLIVSGATLAAQLRDQGLDVVFQAKAYDEATVWDQGLERDIGTAFVGRVKNKVYQQRRRLLGRLQKDGLIQILRAEPGQPYNDLLNRIRIFVSADVGFDEYMIKNFEAMAAGCLLLAWRQPDIEQRHLGFIEGENILLYQGEDELRQRLSWVAANPEAAGEIAGRGRSLVENRHRWSKRAADCLALIEPDIKPGRSLTLVDRFRLMGA